MSLVDPLPTIIPEQSHPLSKENRDEDSQAREVFLQHLIVKSPPSTSQQYRHSRNTNYTPSIGSIVDRAPSSLFELKQQRLLAAADRKKRIIARIVSIVGLLIILLCAAIVTLTLKMAPKIDELVRTRAGAHQLIHVISRTNTSPISSSSSSSTTTIVTTIRQDNSTLNGSSTEKSIFRTHRKSFI